MSHSQQDGLDAAARARRGNGSHWHPILATREVEPGQWIMVDTSEQPYGVIRFLRRGDQLGYRADEWAPQRQDTLLGYFTSLRAATVAVHRKFIDSHSGPPVDIHAPSPYGSYSAQKPRQIASS